MKHGSLFSGIGGFDLASEWMGWENVFHCEWNPFGQKVLKHYWPKAESFEDITKTDFTKYANTIDILTGGFPCQPFSLAGKRKGTDDERYLWGEMLRAIQEIKPKYVIAENVFGITNIDGGLVFEQVCLDLENEGYEVQPFIIPAAAKNAPHRRDRCWFIAYNNSKRQQGFQQQIGNWGNNQNEKQRVCICEKQRRDEIWSINEGNSKNRNVTNTNGIGQECSEEWECSKTKSQSNDKQFERCSKLYGGNFEKFPSQSPICGRNDGLSRELDGITFPKWRAESIKGYGNAIVPQVALEIFKAIARVDNEML
jgi:DNA (cytosine-5)-methyltransferase 1